MNTQYSRSTKIALILLLSAGLAFSSPGDSLAMMGRVENLELQRDQMERELALHKQELSLQVDERADQNTLVFWVAAGIAFFGAASTLVSFWVGIRKAKEAILLQAEGVLEQEVQRKLPTMTDNAIQKAVSAEVAPMNRLLEREGENARFRAETEILCLGETMDDAHAGVERLRKLGYDRLKPFVPTEKRLPPSTAYFFNLFRREPEGGWKALTDTHLQHWIDDDERHQSLFFYFVSERRLPMDTKRMHPYIGFSNRGFTVDTNLIEAIRDYRNNLQSPANP